MNHGKAITEFMKSGIAADVNDDTKNDDGIRYDRVMPDT